MTAPAEGSEPERARRPGPVDPRVLSLSPAIRRHLVVCSALAALASAAVLLQAEVLARTIPELVAGDRSGTGRLVVVHEASRLCGVGAEVAALVAEKAFASLRAPVLRLTGPDAPVPASFPLEQSFVPQADAVVAAVQSLVHGAFAA